MRRAAIFAPSDDSAVPLGDARRRPRRRPQGVDGGACSPTATPRRRALAARWIATLPTMLSSSTSGPTIAQIEEAMTAHVRPPRCAACPAPPAPSIAADLGARDCRRQPWIPRARASRGLLPMGLPDAPLRPPAESVARPAENGGTCSCLRGPRRGALALASSFGGHYGMAPREAKMEGRRCAWHGLHCLTSPRRSPSGPPLRRFRDVSSPGPTPRLSDRVRQALHTEVTQFRTSLAVERRVAASTQNQPTGGLLLFLQLEVLQPALPLPRRPRAREVATAPAFLGHGDVTTTMIYTHVLNRGPGRRTQPG